MSTSLVNVFPNTSSYVSPYAAGTQLVWNTGTLTNSAGSNTICQTSQILQLDGYSLSTSGSVTQTAACSFFKAVINFTISNPLYTDDESDVISMYVILPATSSYNASATFNIQCMLSNLGSVVSSPIYQVTSSVATGGYSCIQIPFNKWFSFRAPGSTYQATIEGFTIQTTVNCNTAQTFPT
jgi:hypothetical protein